MIWDEVAQELGNAPVRWAVNTHAHFDHNFGNQRFGPDSDLDAVLVPGHPSRIRPAQRLA